MAAKVKPRSKCKVAINKATVGEMLRKLDDKRQEADIQAYGYECLAEETKRRMDEIAEFLKIDLDESLTDPESLEEEEEED